MNFSALFFNTTVSADFENEAVATTVPLSHIKIEEDPILSNLMLECILINRHIKEHFSLR